MEKAKDFVLKIVRGIVNKPDDVRVEATEDEMGVLLRVSVNKEDMGIVIGRQGVNAGAIKILAKLYGYCNKLRISVKIEEPK